MLQHQHILYTLFIMLPFLQNKDLIITSINLAIILMFSVLPDIDVGYKKFHNLRIKYLTSVLNFMNAIIYYLIYKPYQILLSLIKSNSSNHRTTTHSIFFILIIFVIFLFSPFSSFALVAILAFCIHLLLDSFTVRGVEWFYPLKILYIQGAINTSNSNHVLLIDILFVLYLSIAITLALNSIYFLLDHTYLVLVPYFFSIRTVKLFY